MENASIEKRNSSGLVRFLLFTFIGIYIFFVPVVIGSGEAKVPLVHLVDAIKGGIGGALDFVVTANVLLLVITFSITKFTNKSTSFFKTFHEKDNMVTGLLYLLSAIFAFIMITGKGPVSILDEEVGGLAIYLAGSVLITVTIAGWLVVFLIEFGFLEFLGTLMEPLMRSIFKLPGRSSVDALASFVVAPAVGVFITNKLYVNGSYTEKEACCITTNFSVCSLGFFALLVSIGDVVHLFPHVIITSLIIVFIMAAIVIRIPPLSRKRDVYFDGRVQTEDERKSAPYDWAIFSRAFKAATEKAASSDLKILYKSSIDAVFFAQKIVAYVLSIAVISLIIANYTPVFTWLGAPIAPVLNLLGLPNAAQIAPACLVGIAEIALPVLIIAGQGIAEMSVFFIIVLSTVQIIFFTESANAMMEADMPINFAELVIIFLVRTAVAIPLVAIVAHMLF
ncbi:nucleoside recognition domain-containing protein [Clostridiaceae bacterium 35-E11]